MMSCDVIVPSPRPNGGSLILPVTQGSQEPRLRSSSSVGIINGGMEAFSTSPLHLPSCSSSPVSLSPIDSPLAVGSFLEQRSRQLFRPTNHSRDEEKQEQEEEQEEAQSESPLLAQEVEEATLLPGISESEPPISAADPPVPASEPPAPHADLSLAVRQRRHELTIMDYDETLPEY